MIFFLCLLLLSSAFLAGSETSLFSLSRPTLRLYQNASDTRLNLIAHLMAKPRDVLVTILILNILSNLLIQNTVSGLFDAFSNWTFKVGVPLALTLLFGEVLPKSISLPNNEAIAYRVAPRIATALRWLRPIRQPLTRMTNWISRFLFFFLSEQQEISAGELRHVLKTSRESGILLSQECDLIEGTLDLQQTTIKELMRPREEVLFYNVQEPLDKLTHLFIDLEISRLPVCQGNLDRVLGILSLRRYFFHREKLKTSEDLVSILKKPFYVPEATRGWALLKNLRERGESLAMVVDEYGSISGLITQEDLIEAVVGEIVDRRDEKDLYTRASENVIIASGKLELSEFEKIFHIPLESKEHLVTLGGWLIEQLGDIPLTGTKYATDQFLFYVLAADPNRIRRIYVRKIKPASSS